MVFRANTTLLKTIFLSFRRSYMLLGSFCCVPLHVLWCAPWCAPRCAPWCAPWCVPWCLSFKSKRRKHFALLVKPCWSSEREGQHRVTVVWSGSRYVRVLTVTVTHFRGETGTAKWVTYCCWLYTVSARFGTHRPRNTSTENIKQRRNQPYKVQTKGFNK